MQGQNQWYYQHPTRGQTQSRQDYASPVYENYNYAPQPPYQPPHPGYPQQQQQPYHQQYAPQPMQWQQWQQPTGGYNAHALPRPPPQYAPNHYYPPPQNTYYHAPPQQYEYSSPTTALRHSYPSYNQQQAVNNNVQQATTHLQPLQAPYSSEQVPRQNFSSDQHQFPPPIHPLNESSNNQPQNYYQSYYSQQPQEQRYGTANVQPYGAYAYHAEQGYPIHQNTPASVPEYPQNYQYSYNQTVPQIQHNNAPQKQQPNDNQSQENENMDVKVKESKKKQRYTNDSNDSEQYLYQQPAANYASNQVMNPPSPRSPQFDQASMRRSNSSNSENYEKFTEELEQRFLQKHPKPILIDLNLQKPNTKRSFTESRQKRDLEVKKSHSNRENRSSMSHYNSSQKTKSPPRKGPQYFVIDSSESDSAEPQRQLAPELPQKKIKQETLSFQIDTQPVASVEKNGRFNVCRTINPSRMIYQVQGQSRIFRSAESNIVDKIQRVLIPNQGQGNDALGMLLNVTNEFGQDDDHDDDDDDNDDDNNNSYEEGELNQKDTTYTNADIENDDVRRDEDLKATDDNTTGNKNNGNVKDSDDKFASELDGEQRQNRYFAAQFGKVCNRCKRSGHFEMHCTQSAKIVCPICLSEEHTQAASCESIVCFRCGVVGHRKDDCPSRQSADERYCDSCKRKHASSFFTTGPDSLQGLANICFSTKGYPPLDLASVVCLYCKGVGHLNCNQNLLAINDGKDKIYENFDSPQLAKNSYYAPRFNNGYSQKQFQYGNGGGGGGSSSSQKTATPPYQYSQRSIGYSGKKNKFRERYNSPDRMNQISAKHYSQRSGNVKDNNIHSSSEEDVGAVLQSFKKNSSV